MANNWRQKQTNFLESVLRKPAIFFFGKIVPKKCAYKTNSNSIPREDPMEVDANSFAGGRRTSEISQARDRHKSHEISY